MKLLLTVTFFLFANSVFSQRLEYYQTVSNLKKQGISIGRLFPHDGFEVFYNCDSIPFLKKTIGDTIRIWTPSMQSAYTKNKAKRLSQGKKFGKTQYITVLEDGRILLTDMHETLFLHRNDSLFEFNKMYDETRFKLIFSTSMFSDSIKTVKLSKDINYMSDEIVLENSWVNNGKKCFTIRINNTSKYGETTYSYTFDEDIRFLYWENCTH